MKYSESKAGFLMEDVISFYTQNSDAERLLHGWGMLEFARTKEIVLRNPPRHARIVVDVGDGTGIHTDWLRKLGYESHLIDITPSHIDAAKTIGQHIVSAEVGDARNLSWRDGSADVVLLLGPLYHLSFSSFSGILICLSVATMKRK
jgi:SAM-dependent methyltransferase